MTNIRKLSFIALASVVMLATLFYLTSMFAFADRGDDRGNGRGNGRGIATSASVSNSSGNRASASSGNGSSASVTSSSGNSASAYSGNGTSAAVSSSGGNSAVASTGTSTDDDEDEDLFEDLDDLFEADNGIGLDQNQLRINPNGKVKIRNGNLDAILSTTSKTFTVSILGSSFTVDASNAQIRGRTGATTPFSNLQVGHRLRIDGVLSQTSSSTIIASRVVDRSLFIVPPTPPVQPPTPPSSDALRAELMRVIQNLINLLQAQLNILLGVTPPVDVAAPVITQVMASTIASTSATISWTTNEPSTSKVYFGTTTPLNLATAGSVSAGALVTNHSMALTNLPASTTHYFVVESKDAANNTATSSQGSFITIPATDTQAPVISAVTTSNIASTSATISWTTNELSTHKLYYGTTSPLNLATATSVSSAEFMTAHAVNLTNLLASTTYYFVAESKDAANNTATSSQGSFVTIPTADTQAPVISAVTASTIASTSATISWTTNELATSKVFFGTTTPLDLATASSVESMSLVLSHILNLGGLIASTTHYFVVESKDAANNTATSSQTSFMTLTP